MSEAHAKEPSIPLAWRSWIEKNEPHMRHSQNYEKLFVEKILSKVSNLDPNDVHVQFPFRDNKNRVCRVDFMIYNLNKGLNIAIELDGLSKLHEKLNMKNPFSFSEWSNYQERQNSLIKELNPHLIRFTNQHLKYNPHLAIKEIYISIEKQNHEFNKETKSTENISLLANSINKKDNNINKFIIISLFLLFLLSCLIFILYFYNTSSNIKASENLHPAPAPAPAPAPNTQNINTYEAISYIGENKIVCGTVVQTKNLSTMTIINLDKKYPQTPFSISIPKNSLYRFPNMETWIDTHMCFKGKIQKYLGKAEIFLYEDSQIIK